MPISEARKRANKAWNDKNLNVVYDHLHLVVPKGDKEKIKVAADAVGESVNTYIRKAVETRMGDKQ